MKPHTLINRYPNTSAAEVGLRLDNGDIGNSGPALDLGAVQGPPGGTMATLWARGDGEPPAGVLLRMDPDAVMALYRGCEQLLEARGLLRRAEVFVPHHA